MLYSPGHFKNTRLDNRLSGKSPLTSVTREFIEERRGVARSPPMIQNCIQDDVHDIEGEEKTTGMYSTYRAALGAMNIHPRANRPTRADIPILFLSDHETNSQNFN